LHATSHLEILVKKEKDLMLNTLKTFSPPDFAFLEVDVDITVDLRPSPPQKFFSFLLSFFHTYPLYPESTAILA